MEQEGMMDEKKSVFSVLNAVNVNEHTETKKSDGTDCYLFLYNMYCCGAGDEYGNPIYCRDCIWKNSCADSDCKEDE